MDMGIGRGRESVVGVGDRGWIDFWCGTGNTSPCPPGDAGGLPMYYQFIERPGLEVVCSEALRA